MTNDKAMKEVKELTELNNNSKKEIRDLSTILATLQTDFVSCNAYAI